jgi:acyl-CoA synthetase (NDP forming)
MGEPAGPVSADAGEPRDAAPTGASASAERVPRFTSPDQAARALGKIVAYSEWRRAAPTLPWTFDDLRVAEARELCRTVIAARGDGWLTAGETGRLFDAFGLPLVDYVLVRSADDAAASAARLGYPVVAKLQSRRLLHKSDAAAVHVGLSSELAVRQSFEYLTDVARSLGVDASSPDEGVVVQPMIAGGIELMVGVTNDPQFGPLVGFGLGGVHVEVLNDVHFRAAPLTDRDVDELLGESRASKLLQGYRKQPPADVASLRDLLFRVSCLASEVPELRELDLNPVLALPAGRGCRIVDARVRVAAEPSLRRVAPSPSAQACALPVR